MVGMGLVFWVFFHLMTWFTSNLVSIKLVILVGWLGVILLNLLALGWQSILLFSNKLSWVYGQGVTLTSFPLEPGCEEYSFLDQTITHWVVLIPPSLTPTKHRNWMHALMCVVSWLLQSLQGSYSQLAIFLWILNSSCFLASNLINYGARLGYYICLYH